MSLQGLSLVEVPLSTNNSPISPVTLRRKHLTATMPLNDLFGSLLEIAIVGVALRRPAVHYEWLNGTKLTV